MKNSVSGSLGALLLVTCTAFALPAYAVNASRQGQMESGMSGMSEGTPKPVDGYSSQTQSSTGGMHGDKGGPGVHQMSGLMNDMASEMKNMAGMIQSGNMSPDMMKKMSSQMKQMGAMMNHMSGMMHKGMKMNAGTQKKMGQMHKQMEHMRKDMPASSMQK